MNFLHVDIKKKSNLLSALQVILPFTFVYKMWYMSELLFNALNFNFGAGNITSRLVIYRIVIYLVSGAVAYGLAALAVSWSYNSFSRSKYSPCDENFMCRINKQTYKTTSYFVLCIANILCGSLNFVAYVAPISTAFVVILMPTILSILEICGIIGLLKLECQKGEFKQLLTAMALPSLYFLLLLR